MWCFVQYLLELVKIYLFFYKGLHFKLRQGKMVYVADLLALVAFSCFLEWGQQLMNPLIPYFVFVIVTSCVTYKENLLKMTGVSIWISLALGLLDGMAVVIFKIISQILSIKSEVFLDIGASLLTIVLLLISMEFLERRYNRALKHVPIGYFVFFTFMILFNELSLAMVWEIFQEKEMLSYVVLAFLFVGIFVQLPMLLLLVVNGQLNREKQKMNQRFLVAQQNQYLYLQKKEEETKRFRHDMRDHMHTIREMAKEREDDKIIEYMDRVFGKLDGTERRVTIGDGVADAIINQYVEIFAEQEVPFSVYGHLPNKESIQPYDICVIFSNILQNAVEAAVKCKKEERAVTLQVRYDEDSIIIRQKNTMIGELEIRDGKLLTTKQAQEGHGYGMQNIVESVNQYQGKVEYTAEKGMFQIYIVLKR